MQISQALIFPELLVKIKMKYVLRGKYEESIFTSKIDNFQIPLKESIEQCLQDICSKRSINFQYCQFEVIEYSTNYNSRFE